MNDWNPSENRLRSWTPRAPSEKLKARLFPRAERVVVAEPPSPFNGRWAWVAPVLGCCLVLLIVSGAHNERYLSSDRTTDWLTTVASNQSYASYIGAGFHSEQNALAKDPIEWTLATRQPRALRLVPNPITNSLIR